MKRSYPLEEAMELFRRKGMDDKLKLFRFRMSSTVNIYEIEGYYDYYYGYMLPNAGYVKWFDVIPYEDGFMLVLPAKSNPTVLEPFTESRKLFAAMESAKEWGRSAGIRTVGDLNEQICSGSMSDLILVQEAKQERMIGEIAKDIASREREVRHDCGTLFLRQDQLFPQAVHPAADYGKGAPAYRPGQLFREPGADTQGRERGLQF